MEKNKIYHILAEMFPNACCELVYNNVFELLISTVLAAQATDKSVNLVTGNLFSKYPTAFELSKANFEDVKEIIKTVGLTNTKAKNIINLSKKLVVDYNGEVPQNFDYLITLDGVGRKTANVVLAEGFGVPRIAVDTHVLRVSNRLNLVTSDNPLVVEKKLMEIYPEEIWGDLHLKLLFFGRYYCKAKNPECENGKECPFKMICKKNCQII